MNSTIAVVINVNVAACYPSLTMGPPAAISAEGLEFDPKGYKVTVIRQV